MNTDKDSPGRRILCTCIADSSAISMPRVIMWLVAIAIVSFTIGIGIHALSGGLSPSPTGGISPFSHTIPESPTTTPIMLDGAASGDISIMLGAGELVLRGGGCT